MTQAAATLVGYYAAQNLGDDTFCHIFLEQLRSRGWCHVYIPGASEALRRRLGIRQVIGTRAAIDRSQLVILGGGGALSFSHRGPREARDFELYWRVAWYCWLRRVPFDLLGVGAGPWTTNAGRRRVRQIVRLARRVIVRDEESHRELATIDPRSAGKIEVLADPAFAIDYDAVSDGQAVPDMPRPCLGVNLYGLTAHAEGLRGTEAVQAVIGTVSRMVEKGQIRSVIWFSTMPEGQELLWASHGQHALPTHSRVVVYDHGDPWPWLASLRACNAFLSMKLHSGIFAAGMGVPVFGVGYHPKIIRFYRALQAEKWYRPFDELTPGEIESFIRTAYPGVAALNQTPQWQRLHQQVRAVFEAIAFPEAPAASRRALPAHPAGMEETACERKAIYA